MKKLLLCHLLSVVFLLPSFSQNAGDYRSNANGNWNSLSSWQRHNGVTWVTPTVLQGYPGQFSGTGAVTILGSDAIVQNVQIPNAIASLTIGNGSGPNETLTFNAGGNNSASLTVSGDLVLDDGNLSLSNQTGTNIHLLGIGGDFIVGNTSSLTTIASNDLIEVVLNGTIGQVIGGTSTSISLTRLTINKNSGDVTLATNVGINGAFIGGLIFGVLTLTDGVVNTSSGFLLTVGGLATVAGGSNSSYINGPIAKSNGGASFTFPVGKNGIFSPITISTGLFFLSTFQAEYFVGQPPIGILDGGIHHISAVEYWALDRTSGTDAVNATLSWRNTSAVSVPSELLVVRYDGSQWVNHGNGGTTGDATAGTVVSSSPISSFSFFTLGTSTANNALPVTWRSFRATPNDRNGVDLLWSTASEANNEGFDVERSANGRDWETIAFVPGAGTTSETQTYQFTDSSPFTLHSSPLYYRLKQIDFDGSFDYSPIRIVEIRNQRDIRVYPNPADEEVTISFAEPTEVRGTLRIYSQQNRLVAEHVLPPQTTDYPVRVAQLPAGTYILQVMVGNEQWSKRVVVE